MTHRSLRRREPGEARGSVRRRGWPRRSCQYCAHRRPVLQLRRGQSRRWPGQSALVVL